MAPRVFAVVSVDALVGKLNAAGEAIVHLARHSLDGAEIILDFNHHRTTIEGLFLPGVDVEMVISGCNIISQQEAEQLMSTDRWSDGAPV